MGFNDLISFFYNILNFKLFILAQILITPSLITVFICIVIIFVIFSWSFYRLFAERILSKFQNAGMFMHVFFI